MTLFRNIISFISHRRPLKLAFLIACDCLCVFLSVFLSVLLLSPVMPPPDPYIFLLYGFVSAANVILLHFLLRVYSLIYRYVGMNGACRISLAALLLFLVQLVFALLHPAFIATHAVLSAGIFFILSAALRFSKRCYFFIVTSHVSDKDCIARVMIIGAGSAGSMLLHEMQGSDYCRTLKPVCLLDDNVAKVGRRLSNVPVVGTTDAVEKWADYYRITHIYVALPSATNRERAAILQRCQNTGCKVLTLPGIYQLLNGDVSVAKLRKVEIADLLGREQVKVDLEEIIGYIQNKTVLVTGTGSIGSELCRQIARHKPKTLLLLDIYENNLYDIEQELRRELPELPLVALVASIRDAHKIDEVFRTYRPEIIFNAAAHKHVPLMETSPCEAVKNNVFGTLNVARSADKYGADIMVQISTDKAVNPTNVMGASKRICEMIIQTVARHSKTRYAAVRFGNVLGSNGSVIPLFQKQIAAGGPVTVTHKDIIRYFMTIPEAVSLVLQAGSYAESGEIFVLDMGEQVKIYDLAKNLIRLSGLEPETDIPIVFTGLRPGEKLYEERLMEEEGMKETPNKLISIGKPLDINEAFLYEKLEELRHAAEEETDRMKELVAELVTTYKVQN